MYHLRKDIITYIRLFTLTLMLPVQTSFKLKSLKNFRAVGRDSFVKRCIICIQRSELKLAVYVK